MYSKTMWLVILPAFLVACGESQPPVINTKSSTLEELTKYQNQHCQDKYKLHPYCVDVQHEKNRKTSAEMRNKPGSLGTLRSPEELFGKQPK